MGDLNSRSIQYPTSWSGDPDVCDSCGLRSTDLVDQDRNPSIPFRRLGSGIYCQPCYLAGADRVIAALSDIDAAVNHG